MTKKKKLLILIACECLLLFTMVTGTIAWLTDKSATVANTFKPSNITVALEETNTTLDGTNYKKEFKMIPGAPIEKDPKVDVTTDINCYVFVEVTKSNNLDTYIEWEIAEGWTALKTNSNVYYREISTTTLDIPVIKNNTVTVKTNVTKDQMNALGTDTNNYPKLTFTAYAIQKDYLTDDNNAAVTTPEGAWKILNPSK